MADPSFTIEVVRASSLPSLRHRARLLLRFFVLKGGGPLGGGRPWLVLRNATGEVHTLWEETDWDRARSTKERLLRELAELGTEAWCDRYDVPATFVDLDDPWRKPPDR
jgi:hypothetical protein